MFVLGIPDIYGGYLCCKWLSNDAKDERKGLMRALFINIIIILLGAIMWTWVLTRDGVAGILRENNIIAGFFIASYFIGCLVPVYYYTVARQYATLHGDFEA